jgi:O-acetyl-ADP-ribose deacetylase (regulator of RNase III)
MLESSIKDSILRLDKGDLTAMEIEAIVFYARPDLVLGSGFGSAIAERGGMTIQEELKPFGTVSTGQAVITSAGQLKASYIVHAVGPRFQEKDFEEKLRTTIENVFKAADEKGIRKIAFPPMGTGFYGIPLDVCARIMLDVAANYLAQETSLKEVIICTLDNHEYRAFQAEWQEKI